MINNEELPIGFSMALAQNSDSLVKFSQMTKASQAQVIEGAKNVETSNEMHAYVDNICKFEP